MSRKLIEVKTNHIRCGIRGEATECPIALALKDEYGHNEDIEVGDDKVDFGYNTNYNLPRSAKRFIKNFDNKKPVKPFKFYLTTEENNG